MKTLSLLFLFLMHSSAALAQQASIEYINGRKDVQDSQKEAEKKEEPKPLAPTFPTSLFNQPREMAIYSNSWIEEVKKTLEAVEKIEITVPKNPSPFAGLTETSIGRYGSMGMKMYQETRDPKCHEHCYNVEYQKSFCDDVVKRMESEGKVVWRTDFWPSRVAGFWFWEDDWYYKHHCRILYFPSREAYRANTNAVKVDKLINTLEAKLHRMEDESKKSKDDDETYVRAIGEDLASFNEYRGNRDIGYLPSFRFQVRRTSYPPYFFLSGEWRDKGPDGEVQYALGSVSRPDQPGGWNGTMFRNLTGYRIVGELEDYVRGGRVIPEVKDKMKLETVHGIQFFIQWWRMGLKDDGGAWSSRLSHRLNEKGTAVFEVYERPVWKEGSNIQAEFWFTLLDREYVNGKYAKTPEQRKVQQVWEPLVSVADPRYKAIKDRFWDKSLRSLRVRHPIEGYECLRMGPKHCVEYFPSDGLDDDTIDELTRLNNNVRTLLETTDDIAMGDINSGKDRSTDEVLAEKLRIKKQAAVDEIKKFSEVYTRFIEKLFFNMIFESKPGLYYDWQWVVTQMMDILKSRPVDKLVWKYLVFVFGSKELQKKHMLELFTAEEIKGLWKRERAAEIFDEEKIIEIYGKEEPKKEESKETADSAKKTEEESKGEAEDETKGKEEKTSEGQVAESKQEVVKTGETQTGEQAKGSEQQKDGEPPKDGEKIGANQKQDPKNRELTPEEKKMAKRTLFGMIMQRIGRVASLDSIIYFNIAIRPVGTRFSADHQNAAVLGLVDLATKRYVLDGELLYDQPLRYLVALANGKLGGKPIVYEEELKDEKTGRERTRKHPLNTLVKTTARIELAKLKEKYGKEIEAIQEEMKKEEESLNKLEENLNEEFDEEKKK